jgi:hypothetical protein
MKMACSENLYKNVDDKKISLDAKFFFWRIPMAGQGWVGGGFWFDRPNHGSMATRKGAEGGVGASGGT